MKSPKARRELEPPQNLGEANECKLEAPDEDADAMSELLEGREGELDELDLQDANDERWDAFILDDDGEPMPDYGDFWFPD